MRLRGERIERTFAHVYDTGGLRRLHVRGNDNVFKRALIAAAGYNLALVMTRVAGIGKPRALQGLAALFASLFVPATTLWRLLRPNMPASNPFVEPRPEWIQLLASSAEESLGFGKRCLSTGC